MADPKKTLPTADELTLISLNELKKKGAIPDAELEAVKGALKEALDGALKGAGGSEYGVEQGDSDALAAAIYKSQSEAGKLGRKWNGKVDGVPAAGTAGLPLAYIQQRILAKAEAEKDKALTAAKAHAAKLGDTLFGNDIDEAYANNKATTLDDKIKFAIGFTQKLESFTKDVGAYSDKYDAATMSTDAKDIISKLLQAVRLRADVINKDEAFTKDATKTKPTDTEIAAATAAEKEVSDACGKAEGKYKDEAGKAFKYFLHSQVEAEFEKATNTDFRKQWEKVGAKKPSLGMVGDMVGKSRLESFVGIDPSTGLAGGKEAVKDGKGNKIFTGAAAAAAVLATAGVALSGKETNPETGETKRKWGFAKVIGTVLLAAVSARLVVGTMRGETFGSMVKNPLSFMRAPGVSR